MIHFLWIACVLCTVKVFFSSRNNICSYCTNSYLRQIVAYLHTRLAIHFAQLDDHIQRFFWLSGGWQDGKGGGCNEDLGGQRTSLQAIDAIRIVYTSDFTNSQCTYIDRAWTNLRPCELRWCHPVLQKHQGLLQSVGPCTLSGDVAPLRETSVVKLSVLG